MKHVRLIVAAVRWAWLPSLLALPLVLPPGARAAGRIVDAVQVSAPEDMIPGVTFREVPYAEYRGRFHGSLTLPYDATGRVYSYDMPVWIIAPASLADGNGTVVLEPFHTLGVTSVRPSGSEGEQGLALKILGPRFLFRRGTLGGSPAPNHTWIGVRWDPRSLTTPFPQARYDHAYEQRHAVSPGSIGAPANRANEVGTAMLADLADAVREGFLLMRGEDAERPFANVARVIACSQSQTGRLLRKLLNDPPSAANGGGAHHVPLFDGWMIGSAGATYDRWPTISAAGVVTPRAPITRTEPTPPEDGFVIDTCTEQDIRFLGGPGNEFVRFGNTASHRSYEIAGASHFSWGQVASTGQPGAAILLADLADSVLEVAALSGLPPDYVPPVIDAFSCREEHPLACANPLDWNPVIRALTVAMEAWITDGTAPRPSAWILPEVGEPRYGDSSIGRDSAGNALGGIRLPDVEVGRGRFYAVSPDSPPAGGNVRAGAYVDRHHRFRNHGAYVEAFVHQADALVAAGFLLPEDHDALIASAARSLVGRR
jgi:hypothetical protein